MYAWSTGCEKLELLSPEPNLKLYTVDGVRLFDDDLEDENLMKDRLVIMSTTQPGNDTSPLFLQHKNTPSSLSGVDDLASGSSTPTTPESYRHSDGSCASGTSLQLPKFSAHLEAQLKKFEHKPCDSDVWKRVNVFEAK